MELEAADGAKEMMSMKQLLLYVYMEISTYREQTVRQVDAYTPDDLLPAVGTPRGFM